MQFELKPYEVPQEILFNYEELKQELVQKTETYKTLVYTEDQIKEAKEDRAMLNKTKKALNDERLRIQREYMAPFDDFKAKVDDLIKTIDGAAATIDKQIKEYEIAQQKEKKQVIEEIFQQTGFQPFVTLQLIWNPKWLNKSYKASQIAQEMKTRMYEISTNLMTIDRLPNRDVAHQYYIRTLDIGKAIEKAEEHAEIERRKAEEEAARKAAEQAPTPAEKHEAVSKPVDEVKKPDQEVRRQWVAFDAYLSSDEARQLAMFCNSIGISIRKHKEEN